MSRDVQLDMALDIDGKLIDVDDAISFDEWKAKCVASGIKNTKHKDDFVYKCPNCGEKVSSVRGEHNEHHFRHIDGYSGEYHSADSIIHTNTQIMINDVLNELINNGIPLKCSSISVYGNNKSNEMSDVVLVGDDEVGENEIYSYDHDFLAGATKSTIEGKINNETNHRADILISNGDIPLVAIEVINTHHDTKEKTALYESLNIDVIKINIRKHEDYEAIKKDYLAFMNGEGCFFVRTSIIINNRFILDLARSFEDFYTELKDYDKNIVETTKLYINHLDEMYKMIADEHTLLKIASDKRDEYYKCNNIIKEAYYWKVDKKRKADCFVIVIPSKHVIRVVGDQHYRLVSLKLLCLAHREQWISNDEWIWYNNIITRVTPMCMEFKPAVRRINNRIDKNILDSGFEGRYAKITSQHEVIDIIGCKV